MKPVIVALLAVILFCTLKLNQNDLPQTTVKVDKTLPIDGGEFRVSFVLEEVPLIIGHNNLARNIAKLENNRLRDFNLGWDLKRHAVWGKVNTSHTDMIRLREGRVGGQFWTIETNCTTNSSPLQALADAFERIEMMKRLIQQHSKDLEMARDSDVVWSAFERQKIVSFLSVKGGHAIGAKLAMLRLQYELGVRIMSLSAECGTEWADASVVDVLDNTAENRHDLSLWGRNVVWEMNRLGMVIDLSFSSYGVALDVLRHSRSPVIFSNSGAYGIHPHHRNVRDDVLERLIENDGVIMVSFDPELLGGYTIDNVVEHLNYLRTKVGIDRIAIGAGYDGFDLTPAGLEDVSKIPALFDVLADGHYTDGDPFHRWTRNDLQKLAGLNVLRLLQHTERIKQHLSDEEPFEDTFDEVVE